MRKIMFFVLITALLLAALPLAGQAQESAPCQAEYTVQAGDWLSKIAEKYLGDPLAYSQIVDAANANNTDTYPNIDNPDIIEPGWLLCIPPAKEQPTAEGQTMTPQPTSELTGSSWTLVSVNGQPALADAPVTAEFGTDGRLFGTSGCNRYTTSYTVDGSTLAISPAAGTMMACPEPIMQQETAFLAALNSTAAYEIKGDSLLLKDANGNIVAELTRQKPVELAGSSWRVLGYNNGKQAVVSIIGGTELTAMFGADGQLSGSAGCNNYNAGYQVDGATLSIGPAAATRKMCAQPEGIMEQEQQYLAALTTAATYRIELNKLELRTADGALVANFEQMAAVAAPVSEAKVTGTITYLQRMALPPDAVVKVQLQDTSRADAPAIVIGEQLIPTNGQQVPFAFEIPYNPAEINPAFTYTLSVRIEDASGKLLFINTQSYPVITHDNPVTGVEVVVSPV